ncbi:hypothetical protein [Dehalobacterium formicoaceticum]|nr:hypothetical protein [Dehalobacterium formicoaceticum]
MTESSVLVQRSSFKDSTVDYDIESGLARDKQYLSIILSRKES